MDELEESLHRTWVQLLLEHNYREVAAIAVDTDVTVIREWDESSQSSYVSMIAFDLPVSIYATVKNSDHIRKLIERAMSSVCAGRILTEGEWFAFSYRVKLMDVEDGWQNVVRELIASAQNANQGIISEKLFLQRGKQPYLYNEMKFASQSEIRIAQEFESRQELFFPLPLAIRAETGNFYEDHREIDFLVCHDGVWGILEVSYHPDRFEKDAEKDTWFKKSGILCIQHYTAERCYQNSASVVNEFLAILAKHKR
jgi:hypothetical protein